MQSPLTVDIVIPVLDEAHVLEKSVATVRRFASQHLPYTWRVVIVDNGSTDGTDRVARSLAGAFSDVIFLQLPQRGRGRALRCAWMQSHADLVCYMDVDLSTDLSALPRVLQKVAAEGFDIATGSRLLRESKVKRSIRREIISRIYNLFLKAVLGNRFSDAQCGFKALSRNAVERIVPLVQDQSWFFDTELLVMAERLGCRIADIPIIWIEDDDSRVKVVSTAWKDIQGIVRLRWHYWTEAIGVGGVFRLRRHP
jgi:glycosyltransferase involved in cell wall biosynthesis